MTAYECSEGGRLVNLASDEYIATWGARLIYDEVKRAQPGRLPTVFDRQAVRGEADAISPSVIADIGDTIQRLIRTHRLTSDSEAVFTCYPDSHVRVTFSANGSYGYIYLYVGVTEERCDEDYDTAVDEPLGPCGCYDYHYYDCPSRSRDVQEEEYGGDDDGKYWEESDTCGSFKPDVRYPDDCYECGYNEDEH
jgi:hypothetical protein